MNPFLCLFVPWLLGWVMILLALGLQWLVCNIGIPALWFHARLAVAIAVQPVEVALYRRLGGPENWTAWNIWSVIVAPKLIAGLNKLGETTSPAARFLADTTIVGLQLLFGGVLLAFAVGYCIDEFQLRRAQAFGHGQDPPLPQLQGVVLVLH